MTENRVEETDGGLNRVDLRPQVTAGAPVAPPPGVRDDTPTDQQAEQRLIDAGREDTEGTQGEDTIRQELGANDVSGQDGAPGGALVGDITEAIAARPG